MDAGTIEAYKFFKANAGYVVGERAAGALALARAEHDLNLLIDEDRLAVVWSPDDYVTDGPKEWGWEPDEIEDFWKTEHYVEGCTLILDGFPVAGLYGIWDADNDYRRIIEAELMLEVDRTAVNMYYI